MEKIILRSIVKDNRDFKGKQLGKANISVIEQDKLSIQRIERICKMNTVSETCRTPLNIQLLVILMVTSGVVVFTKAYCDRLNNSPQLSHVLVSRTCEYVTLDG